MRRTAAEGADTKDRTRAEFLAIPMTLIGLGVVAILLLAGDAGLWAWLLVGVAGLIVIGIALWYAMHRERPSAAPAALPEPPDDGTRRLLVVADGVCASGQLRGAISGNGEGGRTAVHVVAPALGSRTARLTGDEQAYAEAEERLQGMLAMLDGLGVSTSGRVGSHDPLQALEDGLREFPARHVVFVIHEGLSENWLEHGVVDAARERYPVSIATVVVPGDAPSDAG
jgi:hypothetical protein